MLGVTKGKCNKGTKPENNSAISSRIQRQRLFDMKNKLNLENAILIILNSPLFKHRSTRIWTGDLFSVVRRVFVSTVSCLRLSQSSLDKTQDNATNGKNWLNSKALDVLVNSDCDGRIFMLLVIRTILLFWQISPIFLQISITVKPILKKILNVTENTPGDDEFWKAAMAQIWRSKVYAKKCEELSSSAIHENYN